MSKITYDKLVGCSDVVRSAYRLLYPNGLTMEQLEQKSREFGWLRVIYTQLKGSVV